MQTNEAIITHSEVAMTALITDASSNIGMEFCRQLASMGINLLMVSNQMQLLASHRDELANKYPEQRFWAHYKDLTEELAANDIFTFCQANNITIDVLINNAGIFDFKELSNTTPQRIDTYINLHVRTLSQLCLIFGRDMKQRSNGYILNLSSVSCWMHLPGLAMHSATKSYIRAFSRSLHLELKESGVGVTVACPGAIASNHLNLSEKWQRFWVRIGVLDTPEKFVNSALKKMFANKKQYINGFFNRLSILFVSLLPDRIRLIVKHKILDK